MIRWLFSKTVREACAMRKHVHRWYCAQRDLLSPQAIGAVTLAMNELQAAIDEAKPNTGRIRIKMEELEFAANKWLKPYPQRRLARERGSVAGGDCRGDGHPHVFPAAVQDSHRLDAADALRRDLRAGLLPGDRGSEKFRCQSTFTDDKTRTQLQARIQADFDAQLKLQKDMRIPSLPGRIRDWFHGISYVHFVAPTDGSVDQIGKPWPPAFFSLYQHIEFAGTWHTIWFPPDYGEEPLGTPGDASLNLRTRFSQGRGCDKTSGSGRRPFVRGPADV